MKSLQQGVESGGGIPVILFLSFSVLKLKDCWTPGSSHKNRSNQQSVLIQNQLFQTEIVIVCYTGESEDTSRAGGFLTPISVNGQIEQDTHLWPLTARCDKGLSSRRRVWLRLPGVLWSAPPAQTRRATHRASRVRDRSHLCCSCTS